MAHFIHTFNLHLVGILETPIRLANLTTTLSLFSHKWNLVHNAQLENNMRILILWNPETIVVNTVFSSDQCLHLWVEGKDGLFTGFVTFVYPANFAIERRTLWDKLRDL